MSFGCVIYEVFDSLVYRFYLLCLNLFNLESKIYKAVRISSESEAIYFKIGLLPMRNDMFIISAYLRALQISDATSGNRQSSKTAESVEKIHLKHTQNVGDGVKRINESSLASREVPLCGYS